MSAFALIVLALSMSADAFAVALCKGATERKPQWVHALKTGLVFGVIEGITPVIGWGLGAISSSYIAAYDHWVAFILLCAIGIKMIYEGVFGEPCEDEEEVPKPAGLYRVMLTACVTSIDALAVGVTLAFMNANIWLCAGAIGIASFIMVTIGIMVGHYIGSFLGKAAEVLAGAVLIVIGALILGEHMHWL